MSRDRLPGVDTLVSDIHRDGGFRLAHVGIAQAVAEATELVALSRIRIKTLKEENRKLRDTLARREQTLANIVEILNEY